MLTLSAAVESCGWRSLRDRIIGLDLDGVGGLSDGSGSDVGKTDGVGVKRVENRLE